MQRIGRAGFTSRKYKFTFYLLVTFNCETSTKSVTCEILGKEYCSMFIYNMLCFLLPHVFVFSLICQSIRGEENFADVDLEVLFKVFATFHSIASTLFNRWHRWNECFKWNGSFTDLSHLHASISVLIDTWFWYTIKSMYIYVLCTYCIYSILSRNLYISSS